MKSEKWFDDDTKPRWIRKSPESTGAALEMVMVLLYLLDINVESDDTFVWGNRNSAQYLNDLEKYKLHKPNF